MPRYHILTWHVHGNYLYYLTQVPHDFYVLSKPGRPVGYGGRYGHLPWGNNVHDCPVEEARARRFDCVLFQAKNHYLEDQYHILSEAQRALPRIYLEHDPPPGASYQYQAFRRRPGHAPGPRHAVQRSHVGQRADAHLCNRAWRDGARECRL